MGKKVGMFSILDPVKVRGARYVDALMTAVLEGMRRCALGTYLQCLLAVLALGGATLLHADAYQGDQIEVELVSETSNVVPGQTLWVAIRLTPTEGWHTYSKWPGDSGDATFVHEWTLPEGATAGEIQWPNPTWLPFPGSDLVTFSYKGEVFLPIAIDVPEQLEGTEFPMSAHVEWQVCDDICIIEDGVIDLTLPVGTGSPQINATWSRAFSETRANMPLSDHGLEGLFAMTEDRVTFSFAADDPLFAGIQDAWFFPEMRRILSPGPLRDVEINSNQIRITHELPRRALTEQENVAGLLTVLDDNGNVRGFEMQMQATPIAQIEALSAASERQTVSGAAAADRAAAASSDSPGLLMVILFALAGGLLLNLMPCVFPVLSLKVLSFASSADKDSRHQKLHGISYTVGIIVTFMILASILLLLRAGGEAVGWAFQLQSPGFIALIILLFFTMGLSLSGVYEFGTGFMGIGSSLAQRKGYQGSFFTGVLATLVASPCTAPFMGAALGFALSQSWLVAMVVFIFLGLGMALPFLLLSFSPVLLRYLPKPGKWMERFKEFMAFPLYATALYFLWVLGIQVGINGVAVVVGACLLMAFALWLLQQRRTSTGLWRTSTLVAGLGSIVAALVLLTSSTLETRFNTVASAEESEVELPYVPFSTAKLDELRAQGKPVFVNMTAAWCITCLANEKTSLSSPRVAAAIEEMGITYMKGDWTNQDPEISGVLDQFNRPSVPLYILYPADPAAEPVLLPQILTPSLVVEAFNQHI